MAVKLSTHAVNVLGGKAPDNIQAPDLPPEPPPAEPPPAPPDGLPHEPADVDGIVHRRMFSNVLGRQAAISWTPDGAEVWVDGVCYLEHEIQELMARRPDAETMRAVHETKRAFDGTLH